MDEMSWRITPMTILTDTSELYQQYIDIGFAPIEINVPGCLALRAGDSYLVLATTECLAADYKPESVSLLTGRTVPYIYVRSLEAAKERLAEEVQLLDEVSTSRNTVEALVERNGQLLILAQQTQA